LERWQPVVLKRMQIVNSFDPNSYGPQLAPLLDFHRRRPLDAGQSNRAAFADLKQMSIDDSFVHAATGRSQHVSDREMASCCLAGTWLLHDYLDESHTISQGIDTPEGSYWHAIMHRREGDFSNAKYWYRRIGQHPIFNILAEMLQREWDPFTFVDECQSAVRKESKARELCLDIQQAEWEILFDCCYRNAIAA
jgi:hypothetical protein